MKGRHIILQGMLIIEEDNLTLLLAEERERIPIEPDMQLEIFLGGNWITGTYDQLSESNDKIYAHVLTCLDQSFCGLISGIHARIIEGKQS